LVADRDKAVLRLTSLFSAIALRRSAAQLNALPALVAAFGIELRIKIGFLPEFAVGARSSLLARFLIPVKDQAPVA
jgi:hypothetical protein